MDFLLLFISLLSQIVIMNITVVVVAADML